MKTIELEQQLAKQSTQSRYLIMKSALAADSSPQAKPFKLALSSKADGSDNKDLQDLVTAVTERLLSSTGNSPKTLRNIIASDLRALFDYDKEVAISTLVQHYFYYTLPAKLSSLIVENELAIFPPDSLLTDESQITAITAKQKNTLQTLNIPFETPHRQLPIAISVTAAFGLVMPIMAQDEKLTTIIATLASVVTFSMMGLYYLRQSSFLPNALRIENNISPKHLLLQALGLGFTLLCGIASFRDSLHESNATRSLNVGLAVAIVSSLLANFNQLVMLLQRPSGVNVYHYVIQFSKKALLTLPGVFATVYTLGHIHEQEGDTSASAITQKIAAAFCIVSFSSDLISEVSHLAWEAVKYLAIRSAYNLLSYVGLVSDNEDTQMASPV